jgi:anti-anti-sigma factor
MTLADLHFTVRDEALVAQLTGQIDLSNADDLARVMQEAAPNDALGIIVDLTEVAYLDSAGIRLIYQLRESFRARGQKLELIIAEGSPVGDALRLSGVKPHALIFASVEDALMALRAEDQPTSC